MNGKDRQSRRDFLRNAVMLAGAGVTVPLWAAASLRSSPPSCASTAPKAPTKIANENPCDASEIMIY